MAKTNLKINTKIELMTEDGLFKSVVQDIQDGLMYINIPIGMEGYLPLQVGKIIDFNYFVENVGYFNCSSRVLKKVIENNIPMYMVTLPKDEIKIQRRNFVRVETIEHAFYSILEEEKWKRAIMLDLSGGGMRIKINEEIELGKRLRVNIIQDDEKIQILGEIIRVESTEGLVKDERIYGVSFDDMNEFKRDKIIKKVFALIQKQRRLV
ncbi:flagellar brake protein [Clostridium chrysemydis]|uniref:flagellar brake protein n=1 Tax=Clostridium chrysemydis TaxID=2665504 RepID=UPI0018835433|nr:PilZ domain-containing protein [Clostridium chrysemydis]